MRTKLRLGVLACVGLAMLCGPAVACSIPLDKMTPEDVEYAAVAFVGTVKSIEDRGVEILDHWPGVMACQRIVFDDKPMCPTDHPVTVAEFEVEEPIHGVETGQEFAVPQGQGADCATYYDIGTRYLFGSTGINGQVWVVDEGMTAQQAMAEWETLPQDTREGKRVEPFVKPWKAHVDNAEAAVIDGSHAGIDAKVLNELVSALRWQQEAPDTVEISKLRVMQLDTETGQYGLLTDLKGLNWRNPNVRRMLAICGDFDIKDKAGKRLGVRPFGIVPEDDLAMLPTPNAEFGKDDTRQSERTWRNDYQYTVLVQWGCIEPA